MQAQPAYQLNRQEAGDEAAVEQVDRPGARDDVEPPCTRVGLERLRCSDVAAQTQRIPDAVGDERRVAQAKVQTLCTDGRDDVSGFADEGDAVARGALRYETREREDGARPDLSNGAEQTLQACFKGTAERSLVETGEPSRDRGAVDPDEARGFSG